jgi:serine/threonine protein kinase
MASAEETSGPGDRSDPLVGQIVANHRVLWRIGEGGMGAVYLAQHLVLGRHAAIKVLLPELSNNPDLIRRFLNEARATAQLRHPGFVEIFDSGRLDNGSEYLVMEYLRGANVAAAIEWRRAFTSREAIAVLRQVAASVAHAHKHGIVHRDLKPDNIFLAVADPSDPGDGRPRATVKVLDFGIAKLTAAAGPAGGSARTRTGSLLGTPLYMSPEQCRGAGYVDHRTDIYSLGCIAYHALTGQPPFPLEGFGEIIAAHLNTPVLPLRAQVPSVPEPLEAFVLAMLAKDPGARPQTMDAVVTALDQIGAQEGEVDLFALIPPAPAGELAPLSPPPGPRVATTPMSQSYVRGTPTPLPLGQGGGTRRLPVDMPASGPATFSTFAGAAAEVRRSSATGRSSGRRAVGVGLGVLGAAGLAAALVATLGHGSQTARVRPPEGIAPAEGSAAPEGERAGPPGATALAGSAAAGRPGPQPPAAAPGARTDRPDSPAPQATVTVRLSSVPAGAEVMDSRSRRVLGVTPFEAVLPREDGEAAFVLSKGGFRPKRILVDMSRDTEMSARLERHPAAATHAPDDTDDDRRKL